MAKPRSYIWTALKWILLFVAAYIVDVMTHHAADRDPVVIALVAIAMLTYEINESTKKLEKQLNDLRTSIETLDDAVRNLESSISDDSTAENGSW